jgi:hypothetical protein
MNKGDVATLIMLEALKTRREGMIALNAERMAKGLSFGYGENEFSALEAEIRGLLSRTQ